MMIFRSQMHRKRRMNRQVRQLDTRLHIRVGRFLFYLALFFCLHIIAMMIFEKFTLWQSIWLTATTITTVGYGDISAVTWQGQLSTVCLLYGPGITLLAQIAGDYIDLRVQRREKMTKGYWRWEMEDHLVVINIPQYGGEEYLKQVVTQMRATPQFESMPVQLLTEKYPDGLPEDLRKLNIFHYTGDVLSDDNLKAVTTEHARYIVVLCEDTQDPRSDSVTLDILDRMKCINSQAYILAECAHDSNRSRLFDHGANAVIRPMRAYPAFLVRALAAPGSELLLEDLFNSTGEFVHRYRINIANIQWMEIMNKLMKAGVGTPLGFTTTDEKLVTNPKHDMDVNATSLFVLTDEKSYFSEDDIKQVIS